MTFKHTFRGLVRNFGIDIIRYPSGNPLARTLSLLQHHAIDCVVDVGANDGGFASTIRALGYRGRIISFEPLSGPFNSLQRRVRKDPAWEAFQYAIGDRSCQVTINVAGNAAQSSSLLPMLGTHLKSAPASRYVGTETAVQRTLDELLPGLGLNTGSNRVFLKVDVQGYEGAVLDGASRRLADQLIIGLQLELSLVPLYDGAMTYREAMDRATALGMTLMGLDPVFANRQTGQLLQADAVYFAT